MPKVVVAGGGPAGLAAAEALLDGGPPDLQVILCTMGHILGGKACSWETGDGRTVEHGQHVVLGFYDEMRALLRRSGVAIEATSVSGRGHYTVYEERDGLTHRLHLPPGSLHALADGLAYDGWTAREKLGFSAFFARALAEILARGVAPEWDDLCFTAWCLERGCPASVFHTALLRASRDAQLNWPGESSAYAMLKAIRAAGRDYRTAEARFPAGGMTATWWNPVAERIRAMGGRVDRLRKLVRVEHDGARARALVFARPRPHAPGHRHVEGPIPVIEGSESVETRLDACILTLPPPALWELVRADPALAGALPFRNLPRLSTVAPLGLHVWHRAAVRTPHRSVALGLAPPLGYVVDNKHFYPRYRDDPRFGSALHFVGQETCFEGWPDERILRHTLASARRVEGYGDLDPEGVVAWRLVRNRAPHGRYWNTEPGSLAFKPRPRTPVGGLYLAGDWVRSGLDFPCMENAIRSGREAAGLLLRELRRSRAAPARAIAAGSRR